MKTHKKAILCCLLLWGASGCSTVTSKPTQTVTKAMTLVPTKPVAPDPETADQREIALYIVRLRGWGNQMAIQLEAIGKLIEPE